MKKYEAFKGGCFDPIHRIQYTRNFPLKSFTLFMYLGNNEDFVLNFQYHYGCIGVDHALKSFSSEQNNVI